MKSTDQDSRAEGRLAGRAVSVKCTLRDGVVPVLDFSGQGENGALRSQRRLPQNNCRLEDQKLAAGCIIIANREPKWKPDWMPGDGEDAKTEILAESSRVTGIILRWAAL